MRVWLLICSTVFLAPALAQPQPPQELFLPILINGVAGESFHFQTVFRFLELSGTTSISAVIVQIDAYDNAGKPVLPYRLYCAPRNPLPVHLPGSGSFHFGTSGFAHVDDLPASPLLDGWARLTITGPGKVHVAAEVVQAAGPPPGCLQFPFCWHPSPVHISDAAVQAVKAARVFRAPAFITACRHTAYSIVNPSTADTAHVSVELLHQDGSLFQGGSTVDIPPLQRRSAFAWEWVAPPPLPVLPVPVPDNFYGSARIVSDVPVAVGALQVLLPEGKLVSAAVTAEP